MRELLLPVAGEWAQFGWWLSIDTHDLPQAHSMYNKASEWAHEGADAKFGGYLLSCKSELAAIGGDYQEARRLAEAAQRDVWQPTPALASWALLRQAHAHAFVGEYNECQAKLGEAEELLTASNSAEEPHYIYWLEPEYLSGDRGMCYISLGRGEQGAEQIDAELRVLAPDRLRDRGWCLARQGEAYVLAGEPDRASAVIGEALAISQATGSTRILEKVRSVRGWFPERWRELPATRDLDEQIRDADGPAL